MNQCSVPCLVLTVASCLVYRFLREQVKWTGINSHTANAVAVGRDLNTELLAVCWELIE